MNVFQKKHVYFPLLKGVLLILPADMEGVKTGGSGPLPQIDLSVIYKRLRSDGLKKKKGKGTNKSMQCAKPQFCITGTAQLHEAHAPSLDRLLPPAWKRS